VVLVPMGPMARSHCRACLKRSSPRAG
jgi:hypothetical protein